MGLFIPTPASEDLASFLQGLEPGSHVAVDLQGLEVGTALGVSRQAAAERGDHFLVVGDDDRVKESIIASSLGEAMSYADLMVEGKDTLLVVDAQTSVRTRGASAHAMAESNLGRSGIRLTVVCLYTEEALERLTPAKVDDLHVLVAMPGKV
ncbi:MAG TPA: hypothetical protein VM286_02180 [Candidatus Thermoplasmatota archaeon]|nr:hypothetical protein [Candidatus Thermoplasmatota archaeon]